MTALRGLFHAVRSSGGRKLYLQALAFNVQNNLILGPPTYAYVATYHLSEPFPPLRCAVWLALMVCGHSIGYYVAHRLMHTRAMYWAHRFHHRYNTIVLPSTANAVSAAEYTIAYMLPFVLGCMLLRPDSLALNVSPPAHAVVVCRRAPL